MMNMISKQKKTVSKLNQAVIAIAFAVSLLSPVFANEHNELITRSVVAKQGDTLAIIAREELGRSGLAPLLADFNNLSVNQSLTPGQSILIPLFTPSTREFATVVFVKGKVLKGRKALNLDDKIYLHELLITGDDGFASMVFESGSVVNLQPKTHAKLEKLNCLETDDNCLIVIDSAQGEISSDVKNRDGQETDFRIKMPYASAAVRGTFFEVNADNEAIVVGVTEGEVLLNAENSDVPLDQGFGSVAEKGNAPSAPIALLPAPVYRYIPTRAAPGDRISWWNLTNANTYLSSITTDEAGVDIVAGLNNEDSLLPIKEMEAGDYFLNVRGIDPNGLKGFISSTRLTVASIDPDTAPVNTQITREGEQFLVEVVNPEGEAPGYEIQVSRTEDFTDPLSVDTNSSGSALFRLDSDKIFTRARVLLEPKKVSEFGEISASQ